MNSTLALAMPVPSRFSVAPTHAAPAASAPEAGSVRRAASTGDVCPADVVRVRRDVQGVIDLGAIQLVDGTTQGYTGLVGPDATRFPGTSAWRPPTS